MSRTCELTEKRAQFGNNVSHAQNKTRRRFNVNIQNVSLRSDALERDISLNIAVSTLRSIDHNGGLDNYLLTTSNRKLSDKAVSLKKKIKAKSGDNAKTAKKPKSK